MEKNDLIEILKNCLKRVFEEDAILREIGVDERCINHRLAMYMSEHVEEGAIKVDTEYNRHLKDQKYYEENTYGSIDILVHERGTDQNNIVAFECKKERISKTDLVKIHALLRPDFNYRFGVTIEYKKPEVKLYQLVDNQVEEEIIDL
jgi:citrate lyase synthetase